MNEVGLNRSLNKRVVRDTCMSTFIGILAVVGESTVDDRLVFSATVLGTVHRLYCQKIHTVYSKDDTSRNTMAKSKETVATQQQKRPARSSARLASKKRPRNSELDEECHHPRPGGSAFQQDCGILPSE